MQITSIEGLPAAVTALFARFDNLEALVKGIAQAPQQPIKDKLLSTKEAADYLNLSMDTIYMYVHKGTMPYIKKGGRLRFSENDLTDWLRSGKKAPINELAGVSTARLKKKGAENA